MQSAVLPRQVVCPSVRLSVTMRYLRRTPRNFRPNTDGVRKSGFWCTKAFSETRQDKIKVDIENQ